MTPTAAATLCAGLAYLCGSVPFGYVLARFVVHADIRERGSGNIGATNVARVLGRKWGVLVLCLDCLKGLLPTLLLPRVLAVEADQSAWLPVLAGMSAVVGHMFPVWLRFRGGKGVATGLGVGLVISWQATIAALAVFAVVFAVSRRTSVASLAAAAAFCITQLSLFGSDAFAADHWAVSSFAIAVPTLIILRHRTNIVRILRRQEPRFGDPA